MMFLFLLALTAYANAASFEKCRWSDWSECVSSQHCPNVPAPLFTFAVEATSEWDKGRDTMQFIMKEKAKSWKEIDECTLAGTCPELAKKPLPGAYTCTGGIAGDAPCLNINQRSFLNFVELGYGTPIAGDSNPRGNDVWGWRDPQNGDEYAIMGLTGGTSFVRVTNPEAPVAVGFIYSATVSSSWRDIKVIGNYAYIVSEARDHGLQVFDLTRLRGRNSVAYFTPDAVNKDFGNAHNIVSNEDTNFVYVVGATQSGSPYRTCAGGLLVIDVRNPLSPTYAGCFGGDGYVHDAQCVNYKGPDTRYANREICFCFNEDTLTLVDVTNKAAMTQISKTGYTNAAYTHQGWVTEDHQVILLDDEQDEYNLGTNQQFTKTYYWNIASLTNPTLQSVFQSSERSIDHNQYIIGDYTYQANYEAGLRMLRINRSTNTLTQVAYFDVYPARTAAQFNGAWSVYPYFQSGNIAVSSINHGLFMVTPNWAGINKIVESGKPYAEKTRNLTSVAGSICERLSERLQCDAPVLC
jgi:choice-of-anchor B domain-containing protein